MIQADYNIVNLVCVIFSYAQTKKHKNCRKLSYFLLARARARGYRGDIKAAFQNGGLLEDMLNAASNLSRYICVNDLCEMGRVLDEATPPGPLPKTVFRDPSAGIPCPGVKGARKW